MGTEAPQSAGRMVEAHMAHINNRYAHEPRHKEWLRIVILVVLALPMCLTFLNMFGFPLTEEVWTLHILVGVGILLVCGALSLLAAHQVPIYATYAVGFFVAAFLLWFSSRYTETEAVAYMMSFVLSCVSTLIVGKIMRE